MACLSASLAIRKAPNLVQRIRIEHYVSSRCKTTTATALKEKQQENVHVHVPASVTMAAQTRKVDPLDLTFSNTKEAYKSKTTFELVRALLVLKLSSYGFLVNNHAKVL